MLMNLDREASQHTLHAGTVMFAVSLKLPALEYLLEVTGISDQPMLLPTSFWGVNTDDFKSLEGFVNRISSAILATLSNKKIDPRKKKLFQLIYQTKGAMTVAAMSDEACWTARQINRYFNDRVGLSLKEYCSILKFHASFPQIKEGRLFPEGAFADQAHFIKTIKKFSGVTPKALSKNKNDRFIQFSATPEE